MLQIFIGVVITKIGVDGMFMMIIEFTELIEVVVNGLS
jgi:hypothetical protein